MATVADSLADKETALQRQAQTAVENRTHTAALLDAHQRIAIRRCEGQDTSDIP